MRRDGRIVYQSAAATVRTSAEHVRAAVGAAGPVPAGETVSLVLPSCPNSQFKLYAVPGCTVVLDEDVARLQAAYHHLEREQQLLARRNAFLAREHEVSAQRWRVDFEAALLDELARSLSAASEEIDSLLADLDAPRTSALTRWYVLMRVRNLVAYCKRKGAVVLALRESAERGTRQLGLALEDMASGARTAGASCGCLVETAAAARPERVLAAFEVVHALAAATIALHDAALMYYLTVAANGELVLRAGLEWTPGTGLPSDPTCVPDAHAGDERAALVRLEAALTEAGASSELDVEGGLLSVVYEGGGA